MSFAELVFALVLSIGLSYFVTRRIIYFLREKLSKETGEKENYLSEYATYVGIAEQMLYIIAWYYRHPEFIAVWFLLKAASQWRAWSDTKQNTSEKENENEKYFGRARFNIYLLGTAISVITAATAIFIASGLYCGSVKFNQPHSIVTGGLSEMR